jgi:glucose dehydrogenase-like enzyme
VIQDSIQDVGAGGIVCLTGVGTGGVAVGIAAADVAAAAVLKNNVVAGSVNANRRHWYKAGQALARADRSWLARLLTRRERPENFMTALHRKPEDIKVSFSLPTHSPLTPLTRTYQPPTLSLLHGALYERSALCRDEMLIVCNQ